ncbi:hypothetical protein ABZ330_21855 [Streptomyces sp. NPDC006172]|uniref:hypothetical protein n=1 Tax=Streptomyces sp. NPDC006172 TaxID=3154470 RepID=UPI0033E09C5C
MPIVTPRYESMQYDGTNGPQVVEWLCGTAEFVSDDGAELAVMVSGEVRRIPAGDWVIANGGGNGFRSFSTEQTATDYTTSWVEVSP